MVRIDRLGEDAQEVLRVLAVAERADHALLAETSALDAPALRAALRDAVPSHLIVAGADGRHAFRHALLREVVVDDLLPGEREACTSRSRARSRRAARARRSRRGSRSTTAPRATAPPRWRRACRAAQAARAVHAHGEEATLLERVLELWDHVPEAGELVGDRPGRAADRGRRGARLRRRARARRGARAGGARGARRDARPARVAGLLEHLARWQWRQGRSDDALATAQRGLDLVAGGRSDLRARAAPELVGQDPHAAGPLPRGRGRRARRARTRPRPSRTSRRPRTRATPSASRSSTRAWSRRAPASCARRCARRAPPTARPT